MNHLPTQTVVGEKPKKAPPKPLVIAVKAERPSVAEKLVKNHFNLENQVEDAIEIARGKRNTNLLRILSTMV